MKTSENRRAKERASIILNQIGGKRFLTMTGAKHLMHDENGGLSFRLPRFPGVKINQVKIELTPMDTYKMTFGRVDTRKMEYYILEEIDGVYFDQLESVFTDKTGIATSL